MSNTVLNESQRKLIDLLSLGEALDDINSLFNIRERAVGTPGEYGAVKLIETRFKEVGSKTSTWSPSRLRTLYEIHLAALETLERIGVKVCARCYLTFFVTDFM